MITKKAQVTLFIILALVIVGGIIIVLVVRGPSATGLSADLEPVYEYYRSCLEESAKGGIQLMGQQGGYIDTPPFIPGSSFMPFSSQLDFLGTGVPYWLYVSGNNLLREQVPTLPRMQEELQEYVLARLDTCDFSDFEVQGYDVYVEGGDADVRINEGNVEFSVKNKITIFYGEQSAQVEHHEFVVESKLGKFYRLARSIYTAEKNQRFLENYTVDVMRLYAPVTGTEVTCSPKIFVEENIKRDLASALSDNLQTVKLKGDYYELSSKERDYFVSEVGAVFDENVNFLYVPSWPTSIEVYGDMVVEPIGLQEGLGLLGFCYVPYHFVYDINYPVMVQLFNEQELFQFPLAVVISKNQPRSALPTAVGVSVESPICQYKNQEVVISSYDAKLNPVPARITFKCLDTSCNIGETKLIGDAASLTALLPQCVNGVLTARAPGYADAYRLISSNTESYADIILSKKYNLSLDLGDVDKALVTFSSDEYSSTVIYPEMKFVELIEGYYNVSVYAYENSSIRLKGINERKCVDVPESGLAGVLGAETEKCYDINIPATDVSYAITGGGVTVEYFLEDVLSSSRELNINVPLFGTPRTIEELQANYAAVEDQFVYLSFE